MNRYLLFYCNLLIIIYRFCNLAYGTNETFLCARTSVTEVDRQPWWQVDLGRDYVILGIDIASNDDISNFNLHAPEYFIGASTTNDLEFKYVCEGRSYYTFKQWPPKTNIVCQEPMVGRYVVIKKLQACEGMDTCPLSHLPLSLCEVEVQGYLYDFDEEKARDIAFGTTVKQSGIIREPELAVDGVINFKPLEINIPQCTVVTKSNAIGPIWNLKFPTAHKIAQVVIYTNETDIKSLSVLIVTLTSVHSTCWPSEKRDADALTFECNKETAATGVFILPEHGGSLVLCEVHIFAVDESESVNLALGKPTNQSSTEYNGGGHLAVDGIITRMFYPYYGQWIAQCTHTSERGDKYPWWRVDLLKEYIVSTVYIYNRGETLESRLHDIEVRIGNYDIIEYATDGDYIFRSNPLCYSSPNKHLYSGQNIIKCPQDLVGRYVSIQIVQLCTLSNCHWTAKERNMLTLCEVEVYGDEIIREAILERNIAAHTPIQHSLDEDDDAEIVIGMLHTHIDVQSDDHPWLLIDLTSKSLVDWIHLILEDDSGGHLPDFAIRVGNEKISADYNSKIFEKNILCYHMINGFANNAENQFNCHHPLVGRYVSLQVTENCTSAFCLINYQKIMSLKAVEVWGFIYHELRPYRNIAFHAENIEVIGNIIGESSLAIDGRFPSSVFETEFIDQCAETVDYFVYPWFQVQLGNMSLVDSVSIILPGNGDNNKLHDFEIRVGFTDLSDIGLDEPFTENALCFKSGSEIYPEGIYNKFPCTLALIGTFVTIQIVEKRYNPILFKDDTNVLQLCEVQISGYSPPANLQIQNLSLKKSTIQSSTNGNAVASLANNGVDEMGYILTGHFESCLENTASQCTVDTSQLRDCSEVYKKGCKQSGVYILSYKNDDEERVFFSAYCDMDTDGGGWTVFQRRNTSFSRQVKFENSWVQYKEGFGNLCGEFWLGNEFIYNIGGGQVMRVDLTIGEEKSVLQFDAFSLGDEDSNYTAHAFYYHGDIDAQMEFINGNQFQTYDRNSMTENVNGGWWFSEQNQHFNLNGDEATLILFPPNKMHEVDKSEIKLRPIGFS